MEKKISLTGIKPTGNPHLGNYLGAIKPALEMVKSGQFDGHYFIADYHSLTSIHNAKQLRESIYEVAASWLAFGLNKNSSAVIYRQSDIQEIMEINWILSCFSSKGLMNRAHAYKSKVQENISHKRDPDKGISMGLYSYPILMAADILFIQADTVPVGNDQLQHIEIARDIANAFNHHYGDIFKLPEPLITSDVLVPGLDGRKMSKSYDNCIDLFLSEKQLKKKIGKIVTDSSQPGEPKDYKSSFIFDLYKFFSTEEKQEEMKQRFKEGISWGEAKEELFKAINLELEEPREIYNDLIHNPSKIDEILAEGAQKVRPKAQEFLEKVKSSIF